jgi:ketosteroid isomerase-like protein
MSKVREQLMNNDNVAAVRNAYAVAERKDLEGWINLLSPDGVFVDNRWVRPTVVAASPTRSATTARRSPTCTASYIASTSMAMSSWCN